MLLGADVVNRTPGHRGRHPGLAPRGGTSNLFLGVNRNKKAVVLDLTTDAGLDQSRALVVESDVLLQNVRRSTLAEPVKSLCERPTIAAGLEAQQPTAGGRTHNALPVEWAGPREPLEET